MQLIRLFDHTSTMKMEAARPTKHCFLTRKPHGVTTEKTGTHIFDISEAFCLW